MAFAIVVPDDSNAHRLLLMLPPKLRGAFWEKIQELNPSRDARPTKLPGSLRGLEYRFKIHLDGVDVFFLVMFQFADTGDENTLVVSAMAMTMM